MTTDKKISDLTALTAIVDADYLVAVDVSDTTQGVSGSTKKILLSNVLAAAKLGNPFSGRLTLTTALAVTTADVTGATTLYFTPYKGDTILIYDGTNFVSYTFAELSQTAADTTKSPAAVANNSLYDIFVWNDGGTLRATRGPAWTSDTVRGTGAGTTELELYKGIYVNKNAITNGAVARKGTYVGTVRSNGSAQFNDSAALRHVWNNYNRVTKTMKVVESTDSWNWSTASYQQARAQATNQLDFVVGLAENAVTARVRASGATSGATRRNVRAGIGLDSATVNSADLYPQVTFTNTDIMEMMAFYSAVVAIGRHYLTWLEYGNGSDTQTWYGDNAAATQNGITGELFC